MRLGKASSIRDVQSHQTLQGPIEQKKKFEISGT